MLELPHKPCTATAIAKVVEANVEGGRRQAALGPYSPLITGCAGRQSS